VLDDETETSLGAVLLGLKLPARRCESALARGDAKAGTPLVSKF
jgi:hypothetical protein